MYQFVEGKGYRFIEPDDPEPDPQPRCHLCGRFISWKSYRTVRHEEQQCTVTRTIEPEDRGEYADPFTYEETLVQPAFMELMAACSRCGDVTIEQY